MALDGCFHVLGEVGIHNRRRVLGKERDALGDGPARRGWRIEHGYRQLAAFDHDFRAGAHARKHIGEVAGGFASEMWITWSALARLYRHPYSWEQRGPNRRQIFCGNFFAGSILDS
jgi:hypothetical protein